MKNSTLLFRSLAIIIFFAGIAHIFSSGMERTDTSTVPLPDRTESHVTEPADNGGPDHIPEVENIDGHDDDIDYIIGNWSVKYNTDDFNGSVLYQIIKENGGFNAYTMEYRDENGISVAAEGSKVLEIKRFDGYRGEGNYVYEYEGKKYNVECSIDMVDEDTFKLSYDHYGYSNVETWKKE